MFSPNRPDLPADKRAGWKDQPLVWMHGGIGLLLVSVGLSSGAIGLLAFDGGNAYGAGAAPGSIVVSFSGGTPAGACSAGTINTDIEVVDGFTGATYVMIGEWESVPLAISCAAPEQKGRHMGRSLIGGGVSRKWKFQGESL